MNISTHDLNISKQWEQVEQEYNLHKVIGQGSYGQVVQGSCKITNQLVAIKLIPNIFVSDYNSVKVLRELQLLKHLSMIPNNKYTVKLIDSMLFQDENQNYNLFLVMEYFENSLMDMLTEEYYLSHQNMKRLMYNLLCALKFIHSANVVHRDIKPDNILIDYDYNVRICDFGLSRTLPEDCIGKASGNTKRVRDYVLTSKLRMEVNEEQLKIQIADRLKNQKSIRIAKRVCLSNHVAQRFYRAPEIILLEKQYDYASDIWSAGCVFYELIKKISNKSQGFDDQLFQGTSCFPLSPYYQIQLQQDREIQFQNQSDQLKIIFQKLGKQTEDDMSFITEDDAKLYAQSFNTQSIKKLDFQEEFSDKTKDEIQLLKKMIELNPFFRYSAQECLFDSAFNDIRDKESIVVSKVKLILNVDKHDSFDYQNDISLTYGMGDLKMAIEEEVRIIREMRSKNNN